MLNPRTNKPVSKLVFLVFCLALISCGKSREPRAENPTPGAVPQNQAALAGDVKSMTALLPENDQVPGWKRTAEVRSFVPENLWEYIDGGAESYLVYNFQRVVTADYENAGTGYQTVIDIYLMADPRCGFGIYSIERSPNADFIDIGSQGYLTSNALNLWQGPYYIKITAYQEGSGLGAQLKKLAACILDKLGQEPVSLSELTVFPGEGLLENTQRYIARDVLGQSELKNGYTADYLVDGKEVKLFFMLHDNPEQASRSFDIYKAFMAKYGKNLDDHSGEDLPWFSADDSYYGKVIAASFGRVVFGVLGSPNPEKGNDFLQKMQEKLVALGLV